VPGTGRRHGGGSDNGEGEGGCLTDFNSKGIVTS